jgi:eukaryotic-like serine/threonine-protein kinase
MEKEAQIGQLVAGKYRIEQTLGRGGMGVVVAALHEQLNQRVALKFLTDNAYQQPEAVARFVREARAAVQIQSEHVARVMDVGTLDSGAPYMVMEYLRGRDLKDVSTRRGPLPVTEAVDFVLQACDAVAEAHSLGIVHRDLKPSNLFLTERPDGSPLVKVLDFGISKALHPGDRNSQMQMTASAAIMGSPQYMSPEQIRSSKSVDARADVWALGTILHELLTGNPAYVADTVPGLLAMIVADAPPPLSASRRDAPPELEAVILRCLEKDRERRFASVAALARALERFASADTRPLVRRIARVLGDAAPPPTAPAPQTRVATSVQEPVAQTNNTWSRTGHLREAGLRPPLHQRRGVQLAAAAGVLGLGALVWLIVRGSSAPVVASAGDGQASVATQSTAARLAPPPAAATPAAPSSAAPVPLSPPAEAGPTVAPAPVGQARIRPILEPAEAPAPSPRQASEDSDDDSASGSGRSGKRSSSAKSGARSASSAPKTQRTGRPSSEPSVAPAAAPAPPASPAKKADTLQDLFNDTK